MSIFRCTRIIDNIFNFITVFSPFLHNKIRYRSSKTSSGNSSFEMDEGMLHILKVMNGYFTVTTKSSDNCPSDMFHIFKNRVTFTCIASRSVLGRINIALRGKMIFFACRHNLLLVPVDVHNMRVPEVLVNNFL